MDDCFVWAEPYPDLHKICTLFQLTHLHNPVKFIYKPLQPFLQNGPQCGLVALAMIIGKPIQESVQSLYTAAKKYNFTYNGEMFSANDMATLAKEFMEEKYNIQIYSGNLYNKDIMGILLNGAQMLVPFDPDKSNAPGLNKGHKAHWCAISGAIETSEDFYVLARHGKARNVAIWRLRDLANSNSQLFEFSPDRKMQDVEYKLPEGGISGSLGLNNKSVIICHNEEL